METMKLVKGLPKLGFWEEDDNHEASKNASDPIPAAKGNAMPAAPTASNYVDLHDGVNKALSVKPYWANLIANGQKTVEVRSWNTDYKGPLVICASEKTIVVNGHVLIGGHAICVVELYDITPIAKRDMRPACMDGDYFGDSHGQYA